DLWILADRLAQRLLDCRRQRFGEGLVVALFTAHLDGFGDNGADVFGAPLLAVEPLANFLQAFLLGCDDQMAQFIQRLLILRLAFGRWRNWSAALGLLGHDEKLGLSRQVVCKPAENN